MFLVGGLGFFDSLDEKEAIGHSYFLAFFYAVKKI